MSWGRLKLFQPQDSRLPRPSMLLRYYQPWGRRSPGLIRARTPAPSTPDALTTRSSTKSRNKFRVGVLVLLKAMKIELLCVKGCLRWKSALARLRQVLREQRVRESVEIIEVNDQKEAVRWRFLGSPTIRINDCDIEPEAASRSDFGLDCRTYADQEAPYEVPSKEMIRRAACDRIAK
jgi:Domain of unknown function (DUF2703)